jgi:Ca-activated chloride channel family protein
MSFPTPLLLLVLLVVPVAGVAAVLLDRRRSRYALSFTNLELLATLAPRPRRRRWLPVGFFLLALAAAAIAVAQPRTTSVHRAGEGTVILLVDVSGSMGSRDVRPTRLAAAEQAATVFVQSAPPAYRIGLVAFSESPAVLVRPTTDRRLLEANLEALEPEAGTAIGDGLAAAVRVAKSVLTPTNRRDRRPPAAIVLLSDGAQTTGARTPLQGAELARLGDIPVDTVALGTDHGIRNESGVGGRGALGSIVGFGGLTAPMPPDVATLTAIAQDTGGTTYVARSAGRLAQVYRGLATRILRRRASHEASSWFAGLAALLLASALLTGRVVSSWR